MKKIVYCLIAFALISGLFLYFVLWKKYSDSNTSDSLKAGLAQLKNDSVNSSSFIKFELKLSEEEKKALT